MNAKWKVIISVMLIIMAICAIFLFFFIQHSQNALETYVNLETKSIRAVSENIEELNNQQYRKRILSLIDHASTPTKDKMIKAFANRNREELLQLSAQFLKVFKKENPYFSTFGWILPNNTAFLRVHSPENYGDDVTRMRPDIVEANRQRKQFFGYTAGSVGLQYRVVQPVFYGGLHLGVVQFGLEDSLLVDAIKEKLDIPVGIVMPLERFKFIKQSKLPSMPAGQYVIQSRYLSLFKGVKEQIDWGITRQQVLLNNREHVLVKVLALENYAHEVQGEIFAALDISEASAAARSHIIFALSLCGIFLLLSFFILHTSYEALVQKIIDLNNSLEKNNSELELRVQERTAELEQEIAVRESTEKQLHHAMRMESIGRLAGGVAHDFNNILSAINGYAELCLIKMGPDGFYKEELNNILSAGKSAARLTQQLLAFSRKQITRLELLDLNAEITDIRKMLGRLLGEDIEINIVHVPDIWPIKADRSQIEQLVVNLAVNARDAMPLGGRLLIETKNVSLDKSFEEEHLPLTSGDYVLLTVSDNGEGMTKELQENIFEPFFTTKEKGKGTGLGLATVHGIVKQNQGEILFYSEPGQGTTFKIYFPRCRENIEKKTTADLSDDLYHLAKGSETILLVEDDAGVRSMAVNLLTNLGYTVLPATNGQEAIEAFNRYHGGVDLLLTDVVMPKMNGPELAKFFAEQNLSMKVLYMSGYTENDIVHRGVLKDGINFIQKPVSPSSLARAVRDVLG